MFVGRKHAINELLIFDDFINCKTFINPVFFRSPFRSLLQKHISRFQWAAQRVSLREATLRMMAGAAPGRTQQLLDKSLMKQNSIKGGLICGKGSFAFV